MPVKKLKDFLDSNTIKYVSISHSTAYTAQEVAASSHIPGKELAKTVMIIIDGNMSMAVLPSPFNVDFERLKEALGSDNVELAGEDEFKGMFPECDPGAMPPFGNLYSMDVYVAEKLSDNEMIAFNAGTHTEVIRLSYSDFERLVQPKKLRFSE
ncbi:aminoacyl-tRNA deacylase [Candidatus Omnitrophota bacterium]